MMLAADRVIGHSTPEPNTGCWLWMGAAHGKGYGHIWYKGKCDKAHRASYDIFVGSIPSDKVVMHSCDSPACVNPAHLMLGSNQDNMDDRNNKGRQARGESHAKAKLTEVNIAEIRSASLSRHELSKKFGVSYPTVCNIQAGRTWKHVSADTKQALTSGGH